MRVVEVHSTNENVGSMTAIYTTAKPIRFTGKRQPIQGHGPVIGYKTTRYSNDLEDVTEIRAKWNDRRSNNTDDLYSEKPVFAEDGTPLIDIHPVYIPQEYDGLEDEDDSFYPWGDDYEMYGRNSSTGYLLESNYGEHDFPLYITKDAPDWSSAGPNRQLDDLATAFIHNATGEALWPEPRPAREQEEIDWRIHSYKVPERETWVITPNLIYAYGEPNAIGWYTPVSFNKYGVTQLEENTYLPYGWKKKRLNSVTAITADGTVQFDKCKKCSIVKEATGFTLEYSYRGPGCAYCKNRGGFYTTRAVLADRHPFLPNLIVTPPVVVNGRRVIRESWRMSAREHWHTGNAACKKASDRKRNGGGRGLTQQQIMEPIWQRRAEEAEVDLKVAIYEAHLRRPDGTGYELLNMSAPAQQSAMPF